jgi:lipopolysaccharide transport system permease protein
MGHSERIAGTTVDVATFSAEKERLSVLLREVWDRRELLYFLLWKDIKVRYRQTLLGVLWAVLQPVTIAASFSLIFGHLAKLSSDGVPYPLFAYSAVLIWQLFSQSVIEAGQSFVVHERLITKVYFPRLAVPLSAVLVALVDFAFGFLVLIAMVGYYHAPITTPIVTLPLWLGFALLFGFGVGLLLATLNVRYRDVRYTIGFLMQLWLFVTPVVYSSTIVPEAWRVLWGLNPMAVIVEGVRWAIFGVVSAGFPTRVGISVGVAFVILVVSLCVVRSTEGTLADEV